MKEFSGNPLEFQSFWDTFAATIDSNTQLSSINKFEYLEGLLKGQAEAAIAGLAMTEDNYKIAVDILKSRFGKVDLIVSAHTDALVGLAAASSSYDIRKLRFIFDSVEKNVRQLQTLEISSSTYGTILVLVILKKIPLDMKLIILRI